MPLTQAVDISFKDDLSIVNGDFALDESDSQHVEHILKADRGQWRQWPLVGAGLLRQIGGSVRVQAVKQLIKLQLKADGMAVKSLSVTLGDELKVDVQVKRLK